MTTSVAPDGARAAVDSQPLSEPLIARALRWLDAEHPDRAHSFAETPQLRFYAVKDIIEALEVVGADPDAAPDDAVAMEGSAAYKRSTVAMRLRRLRESARLVSRQVPNMGRVRGTIGIVYALPPDDMTPDEMIALFRTSSEEAARTVEELLRRPPATRRAPRTTSRRNSKTTQVYGTVTWPEVRETNRLAELAGRRRPQYVADAIRAYNERMAQELERARAHRGSARAYAPPLA